MENVEIIKTTINGFNLQMIEFFQKNLLELNKEENKATRSKMRKILKIMNFLVDNDIGGNFVLELHRNKELIKKAYNFRISNMKYGAFGIFIDTGKDVDDIFIKF